MRLLLDTQLVIWILGRPASIQASVRRRIDAAEAFVSAASIWEISIKSALGKLEANVRDILDAIEPSGLQLMSITGAHAATVSELPPLHKDPFDRLLVAQAMAESMPLLTSDETLRGYGSFVIVQ